MLRNSMNSKGFRDFGFPKRGPFWDPLFRQGPPELNQPGNWTKSEESMGSDEAGPGSYEII